MVGRVEDSIGKTEVLAGCRHHWIIESPHGPTSQGVCKLCGAVRDFINYVPDMRWGDEISALLGVQGKQEAVTSENDPE